MQTGGTFPHKEPALTVGSIGTLAAAILTLLTAFGLPLSDELQVAILGLIAVAAPIVVAAIARRWVSPAWKVDEAEARTGALEVANEELNHDRAELAKALAQEQQHPSATAVPDPDSRYGYTVEVNDPRRAADDGPV